MKNHRFQEQKDRWPDTSYDVFDVDHLTIVPAALVFNIDVLLSEYVSDLPAYVSACTQVQSDSPMSERHPQVLPKFDKRIYLSRDPRDRLLSLSEFAFKPYFRRYAWTDAKDPEDYIDRYLEQSVTEWAHHAGGFLSVRDEFDILFVRYEDMIGDFFGEVAGIMQHLGISLGQSALDILRERTSYKRMKATSPDHLQHGSAGRHKKMLTPKQNARCLEIAGDVMERLGYDGAT